jgi:shikimate kinase
MLARNCRNQVLKGQKLKNIFLTGFMGCGKTSVGRLLAERLGFLFVDLDEAIVNQAGSSIKYIFTQRGEPAFRELESQVLAQVAAGSELVVSTGGGAVLAERNRALMRTSGCIVNLTAAVECIAARVSGDSERPLLQGDPSLERIRTMLESREPCYADADLRLDTSSKSIETVAGEIIALLQGE